MNIEVAMNIITLVIVVIVYLMLTVAYLVPWRGMDRLRLTLALMAFTWTTLWVATLLQFFHVLAIPLPLWYAWTLRLALSVFGIGSIVEMIRAGAFARRKSKKEIPP